jgi:hypothetical protein
LHFLSIGKIITGSGKKLLEFPSVFKESNLYFLASVLLFQLSTNLTVMSRQGGDTTKYENRTRWVINFIFELTRSFPNGEVDKRDGKEGLRWRIPNAA